MSNNLRFDDTDTILVENRLFDPPQEAKENSNIVAYMKSKGFDNYEDFYQWSL
jgi:acetyl-CoA synthetase